MNKVLITIAFSIFLLLKINAQSVSCQELFHTVTNYYDTKDYTSCYMSTMLAKVEYYEWEGMGFVIAYIKRNEYDFRGSPYIFCGISRQRWNSFEIGGLYGSWGQAFHEYIIDYTCNCF